MTDSIKRQGAPIPFYGHQEGEIAVAVATSDHVNHPFHEGYVLVTTALGSLARSSDCADPAKGGNLCYVAALPVGKAIDLAEKLLGAISTAINSGGNRAAIRSRLLAEVVPESLRAELRDALVEAIGADQGPRAPAREALTVGEAIQAIDDAPVIEYRDGCWLQIRGGRHGKVRYWWPDRPASRFSPARPAQWGAWVDTDGVISADGDEPCRLVPLAEADAPPESRGPIGGDS